MFPERDPASRLVLLRQLLPLVTDRSAAEVIRQHIAQLESLPRTAPASVPDNSEIPVGT